MNGRKSKELRVLSRQVFSAADLERFGVKVIYRKVKELYKQGKVPK